MFDEIQKRYRNGRSWLKVALQFDHSAINPKSMFDRDKGEAINYIDVTDENGNVVKRPITHICAYAITAIDRSMSKQVVFV